MVVRAGIEDQRLQGHCGVDMEMVSDALWMQGCSKNDRGEVHVEDGGKHPQTGACSGPPYLLAEPGGWGWGTDLPADLKLLTSFLLLLTVWSQEGCLMPGRHCSVIMT